MSGHLTPEQIAEAAARKAAQAPHGQKRFRLRVAKIARHLDLAFDVRAMRMSKRITDSARPSPPAQRGGV